MQKKVGTKARKTKTQQQKHKQKNPKQPTVLKQDVNHHYICI